MEMILQSRNKPFQLELTIDTPQKEKIRLYAKDTFKPHTYYTLRDGLVDGKRAFELPFPVSPETMTLGVYNVRKGQLPYKSDSSFSVSNIQLKEVKNCAEMDAKDQRFLKFAEWFSENAAILSAGKGLNPHVYKSEGIPAGEFTIEYFDDIYDIRKKGTVSTPARINHATGVIQVSKNKFMRYTVPMRLLILLHEYAHNHINPKLQRDVTYEPGADFGGLYIYLTSGYPKIDAIRTFLYVFKDANNQSNGKRFEMLKGYIDRFDAGKSAIKCAA